MAAHHNMKSSQSPSRRSIQQAPSRDLQQWHDSTTKSAIPQRVTTYSVIYSLLNCFHVICFLGKSSIHCCIQGYIQNHFPQVNARGSDFSEIVPPWPTRIQTERQRLGHTGVNPQPRIPQLLNLSTQTSDLKLDCEPRYISKQRAAGQG